jgi:hypothetical protein
MCSRSVQEHAGKLAPEFTQQEITIMKRFLTIVALSTGLAAGPAMADHNGPGVMTKENLGGALGAVIGGFTASKIVDGKGRPAATAAGAVGGFVLGQNVAHNSRGGYSNPNRHSSRRDYDRRHKPRGHHKSRLDPINATFMATATSNVRAGPGTRYSVTDRLYRHQRVRVIGKVQHRNWYMVENHGRRGFVYAPLLKRPHHGYRGSRGYSNSRGYGNTRGHGHDSRHGWRR